ncbi:MAG: acetyl-CoA carboxylase biotin carboxyl carrier protein [Candidatus Xenobia bacterium]
MNEDEINEQLQRLRPTVESLARILHEKDVRQVELGNDELRVKLTRRGAALQLATPPPVAEPIEEVLPDSLEPSIVPVTSDRVGRFVLAGQGLTPGKVVKEGDILCYIESMKLMNEVRAPLSGTILEVLVEEGHPVEYGQALLALTPGT